LYEEVDLLTPKQGGANLGWSLLEGTHAYPATTCSQTGNALTDPIFDYDHSNEDASVIGGHLYHGQEIPVLAGIYVFGDFISGRVWLLKQSGQTWMRTLLLTATGNDLAAIVQYHAASCTLLAIQAELLNDCIRLANLAS
jgi:hypothetical protein